MGKIETTKQELIEVTARLREIERERDTLRDRAKPLVVKLLKSNLPPKEVADLSPFSDAWVRAIARANGVPPAARGTRKKKEEGA